MMIGKLKKLEMNMDGTQDVTITLSEDFRDTYDELSENDVNVEITKFYKHRSRDASAYCWSLIDRIAAKTGVKKSEVYRNAIREIGGVSTIVCVEDYAVDRLCSGWTSNGIGWQVDKQPSKLPGCTNVTLWYGSSVYNTKQMAMLIDSVIQDAEALGIPTITPKEEERLLKQWGAKKKEVVA